MNKKLNLILNRLQNSKVIVNRDGVFELRHDILASKIASKLSVEEKAANEAINLLTSLKDTQGKLTEEQLNKLIPFISKIEKTIIETSRLELLSFLQKSRQEIYEQKERKKNQLEKEIQLRKDAELSLVVAIKAKNKTKIFATFSLFLFIALILFIYFNKKADYEDMVSNASLRIQKQDFINAAEIFRQIKVNKPFIISLNGLNLDDSISKCLDKQKQIELVQARLTQSKELYQMADSILISDKQGEMLASAYKIFLQAFRTDTGNDLFKEKLQFVKFEISMKVNKLENKVAKFKMAGATELASYYANRIDSLEHLLLTNDNP
jgi:hypothetical protein